MLWIVALGGEQEVANDRELIGNCEASRRHRSFDSAPSLSCFVNGLLTILAQLLSGKSLSFGRLLPSPFSHFNDLVVVNSS